MPDPLYEDDVGKVPEPVIDVEQNENEPIVDENVRT